MNGLSVFPIKVSNKYTSDDFDEDLGSWCRIRRVGCKGENIRFITDESSAWLFGTDEHSSRKC
jgi:dynein heavy chain 1